VSFVGVLKVYNEFMVNKWIGKEGQRGRGGVIHSEKWVNLSMLVRIGGEKRDPIIEGDFGKN